MVAGGVLLSIGIIGFGYAIYIYRQNLLYPVNKVYTTETELSSSRQAFKQAPTVSPKSRTSSTQLYLQQEETADKSTVLDDKTKDEDEDLRLQ